MRMGAQYIIMGLLTVSIACSTLAPAAIAGDKEIASIEGFWRGVQEDQEWTYVFEFTAAAPGDYSGVIHVYQGDKKVQGVPIDEIAYKGDKIKLYVKMNDVRYEGKVGFEKKTIDGKFKYSNGSSLAMILNRVDPATLPGLAAREGAPGEQYEYQYTVPDRLDDGWEPSYLKDQGIDPDVIQEMVDRVVAGDYGFLHSLVIARNGKLVLEEYFYNHDRESPHRLASITKSVSSLLVGIAIDRGFIEAIDQPMASFFPEYESTMAPGWDGVQLKHILSMSAGVGWDKHDLDGFYSSEDLYRTVFKQPVVDVPGEKFEYVSPNVDLLAGVIKHATGMHADEFAEKHLFEPLGIGAYEWEYGKWKGHPLMDGSLALRTRDMAKIGQMVLDEGKWRGKQVVSEKWIRVSTLSHMDPEGPEEYGYLWWLTQAPFDDKMVQGVYASGWGSQFIFIVPEYNLIVVTTGGNDDNDMNFAPARMFPQYILPAMK